jgi:hypothetical protein
MARYTVTHTCGHTQDHDITGPDTRYTDGSTRRQWIADRRAAEPCAHCRRAQRAVQRTADDARAAMLAEAEGLPALIGTPRQVQWAERIRRNTLDRVQSNLTRDFDDDIAAIAMAVVTAAACRQTEAKWWIDHQTFDLFWGWTGRACWALADQLPDDEVAGLDALDVIAASRRDSP